MTGPGRGGYRQPANPAPVGLPGALSRRTDGGPADKQPIRVAPGGDYGTRDDLIAQQKAAPMPIAGAVGNSAGPTAPSVGEYTGVPFGAPSGRPGEPVTAGVDIGAGPGSELITGRPAPTPGQGAMTSLLQQIQQQGGGGNDALATLLQNAMMQGA